MLQYLKQENEGTLATEQHTFYKTELLEGATAYIKSGITEVNERSIKFFHVMYNGETDEIAATTFYTGIYIEYKERKPCFIPEEIKKRARYLLAKDIPNL